MAAPLDNGPAPPSALLHNLVLFARVLRGAGLRAGPAELLTVVRALEHIDIGKRRDFYMAARCALVRRRQDLATFDELFRVFWRQPKDQLTTMDLRSLGEQRRYRTPEMMTGPGSRSPLGGAVPAGGPADSVALPRVYSAAEVLRTKDFSAYTAGEITEARRMVDRMSWDVGRRRTRRWTGGPGPLLDLRRTMRISSRTGGEMFDLARRQRIERPRSLVLLCDISGSMERYTRMLLHFMHSVARTRGRLEAFCFATRLTRITRELTERGVDRAIERVSRSVPDWAGGTRTGMALKVFNFKWSRRVLRSGGVVLVISDGWDRGDTGLLETEIARLQRACHRLVWLNPLMGSSDYQPLTRGMQAALPYIDDFLPVHNLVSLEQLAEHLAALPRKRSVRAQGGQLPQAPPAGGAAPGTPSPKGHLDARPTFRHPKWGA